MRIKSLLHLLLAQSLRKSRSRKLFLPPPSRDAVLGRWLRWGQQALGQAPFLRVVLELRGALLPHLALLEVEAVVVLVVAAVAGGYYCWGW
jgi:hypothetical protein